MLISVFLKYWTILLIISKIKLNSSLSERNNSDLPPHYDSVSISYGDFQNEMWFLNPCNMNHSYIIGF